MFYTVTGTLRRLAIPENTEDCSPQTSLLTMYNTVICHKSHSKNQAVSLEIFAWATEALKYR